MERYTLAYRLPNGVVRGFVGHGSSRRDAYYDCIRRVGVKLQPFRAPLMPTRSYATSPCYRPASKRGSSRTGIPSPE